MDDINSLAVGLRLLARIVRREDVARAVVGVAGDVAKSVVFAYLGYPL